MKKLLLILALLAIPTSLAAWGVHGILIGGGPPAGGADPCAATAFTGDYQERFECGSTAGDDDLDQELTWTYSNSTAFDDSYSTSDLEGSQALWVEDGDTNETATISWTGTDGNQYFAFMMNELETTCSAAVGRMDLNHSGGLLATINPDYKTDCDIDTLAVQPSGGGTNLWVANISDPNTNAKYIKILYNNGSGSNAAWSAWYSGDGSSWTAFNANGTNDGAQTGQLTEFVVRSKNNIKILDDIRIDTSDIDY